MEGQQQQQQELEGNYGQRADEQVAPAGGNQAAVAPVPNLLHGGAASGGAQVRVYASLMLFECMK